MFRIHIVIMQIISVEKMTWLRVYRIYLFNDQPMFPAQLWIRSDGLCKWEVLFKPVESTQFDFDWCLAQLHIMVKLGSTICVGCANLNSTLARYKKNIQLHLYPHEHCRSANCEVFFETSTSMVSNSC